MSDFFFVQNCACNIMCDSGSLFELRLDGHSTGLAVALARRLEKQSTAAFRMGHPQIENSSYVSLQASCADEARRVCSVACKDIAKDLQNMISLLPCDQHHSQRLWPERQNLFLFGVTLASQ